MLLIEDAFHPGEFLHLVERLQLNSIEVDVIQSNNLFTTPAELLQYDSVILANLPRASGDENPNQEIESFSDAQIQMLVDNCEYMGCGIVMLGGDRSFGAGGWSNTPLEEAMPVDFQIKNDKVSAVGAFGTYDARFGDGRRELLASQNWRRSHQSPWANGLLRCD